MSGPRMPGWGFLLDWRDPRSWPEAFDYDAVIEADADEPPVSQGGCGTPGCRGECCVYGSDGSEREDP